MAKTISPGVYIDEIPNNPNPIAGVSTSNLGMLGLTEKGPVGIHLIKNFQEYCTKYGGHLSNSYLTYAVEGFFLNGGQQCYVGKITPENVNNITAKDFIGNITSDDSSKKKLGLNALCNIKEIKIIYIPDIHVLSDKEASILTTEIVEQCEKLKYCFAIFDIRKNQQPQSLKENPISSKFASLYHPWLKVKNPTTNLPLLIPPGGHIAGIYARTDINHGVHKAMAGEKIIGVLEPEFNITQRENNILIPKGINVIRQFPGKGTLVWSARTCSADPIWKYINVRRLFIYLEESIEKGIQWIFFEPNNESLWNKVKQKIYNFLRAIWKKGWLHGMTPDEAFFVKCDRSTMTQNDIDNGRLVCLIGVAPLKPSEFVIIKITQYLKSNQT